MKYILYNIARGGKMKKAVLVCEFLLGFAYAGFGIAFIDIFYGYSQKLGLIYFFLYDALFRVAAVLGVLRVIFPALIKEDVPSWLSKATPFAIGFAITNAILFLRCL
jgi:hypothetical protein